jgi:hypothetical protein
MAAQLWKIVPEDFKTLYENLVDVILAVRPAIGEADQMKILAAFEAYAPTERLPRGAFVRQASKRGVQGRVTPSR